MRSKRVSAGRVWPALVAPAIGLGLAALLLVGFMALAPSRALAQQPEGVGANAVINATVVVQFTDGSVAVRHITSTAPISRVGALRLAGFFVENDVESDPPSPDIACRIDGDGCPASNCWGCGANNWWQGLWQGGAWDAFFGGWPPPPVADGDIIGFHNGTAWQQPDMPGPAYRAAYDGLEYLRPLQSETTGGYGTANDSLETLLAVAANRYDAREWRRGPDAPPLLAAALAAGRLAQRADGAGKLATAMVAGEGCDLPTAKQITAFYDPATGRYDVNPGYQAWAMIGVRALSQTVPAKAVQALHAMQTGDGGWPYGSWSATSDTNGTALAVQALLAAGEAPGSQAVADGLDYLAGAQNADGGFGWDPNAAPPASLSDTNSTAYALQAILAAGEDPTGGRWKQGSNTPISYLLDAQMPNGGFEWQPGSDANQSATRQAIPGLLGRPFPWASADLRRCEAAFLPVTAK